MKVGDKFRVKDGSQWRGQDGWIGRIERIEADQKIIWSFMNLFQNCYHGDPEKPASDICHFYYSEEIEILQDDDLLPEPEFSLEEINQAQDQMG